MVLPFYHAVSDKTPLHFKHLYEPRSIKQFKEDLDFFLKFYKPIELKELIRLNKENKPLKNNYFHITFDDGLSEFYDVAAPILKAKGIPATVFLNSDFIDNEKLFYRFKASILIEKIVAKGLIDITYSDRITLDNIAEENNIDFGEYLKKEQPYLSSNQIKELIQQGFTFGAHSKNHPLFKKLNLEEQIIQTKESIDTITNQFNLDYKVFSFPFTDNGVSKSFFTAIENDVDLTFGSAGLKNDSIRNHFQRVAMELNKEGNDIIKTEYLYYILKKMAGKNKIIRP
jgi:peptidoglycan/xylan/chitin deacetylase (PgdA/CDA1 family)